MKGNSIHRNFLELCGFEDKDIPEFMPDWQSACEKLRLDDSDVKFATQEWIPTNYDIGLKSVRKLLECWIRETVDLTKTGDYKKQGMKIVYGILPTSSIYYYALKLAAPDKVYVGIPDLFLGYTMQGFFHKLSPLLEEAEKSGIRYGCRHCSLNKTRFAARKLDIIPSPDISWIWGLVCDEGPKTDEFIQCYLDAKWNTHVMRLPRDQSFGIKEDEEYDRVEYLAKQMKEGFEYVQEVIGIKVPVEITKKVVDFHLGYRTKLGELRRLMAADPQPFGGVEAFLLQYPLSNPINTGVERWENAVELALAEINERIANREGILPAGSPKLMFQTMPCCQPWISKMFEENGVLLSSPGPTKKQLMPPNYEDPYLASAEMWLRQGQLVNLVYQLNQVCEQLVTYNFDGILFGFFDFDRWLGSDDRLISRMVEEKTRLPSFYIEGDFFDDRDYSQEALRTRIESISEILKMRKA